MEFPAAAMLQLKEFGLQGYAARAYLALLELGETEARGVSEVANIPSAKVYSTLVQLQRRGLVRVTPGKPRLYSPIPIHEFVERRLREQEETTSQLRASMGRLASMFPIRARPISTDRARTTTMVGRRNVLQHLRACCEAATRTIFAVASPRIHADPLIARHFARASSRGVLVHFTKDIQPGDMAALVEMFPQTDLDDPRADTNSFVLIATFDSDAAMMLRLDGGNRRQGHEAEVAIHTTEGAFCGALRRLIALAATQRASAARAPSTAASGEAVPQLPMRLDATAFAQRTAARIASPPAEARAVLSIQDASDVERDSLWRAARVASKARILLHTDSPRLAPYVRQNLPPQAELRLLPRRVEVAFAILDGHEAYFASQPSRSRGESEALYAITTDPAFVRALEEHFETGWASAQEVAHGPAT